MALVTRICGNIYTFVVELGLSTQLYLLLCILLVIVIFYQLRSWQNAVPCPFSLKSLRPPEDLVTDKSKRDAVLKQGFTSKKIPDNLDAIVIGSGIGGMTTAALMAKAGKKVLVLEQHDQAGGCCHTFIEKGFEFDVGIHYVGECAANTMTHVLVNQITEGQLRFASLDKNFDMVYIGTSEEKKIVKYYSGKEDMKRGLKEAFPMEEKAIDKYFEMVRAARKSTVGWIMIKSFPLWFAKFLVYTGLVHRFTKFFKFAEKSLTQVLDELTDNEELKAALSYSFGDYGTLPKNVPFNFHALLFQHFMYGSFYPVGGASEIAFHIIPVIQKAGGNVLVRANVTNILIDESGKAHGVTVMKGENTFDIYAPVVISAAGILNTYGKLIPENLRKNPEISSLLLKVKSGYSGINAFIGLDGTKEELGLSAKNHWIFTGAELNSLFENFHALPKEEAGKEDIPLLFVSFPSTKDPEWERRFPGKSTCAIVTLGNWDWFKDWEKSRVMKRGEEYEEIKNRIAERAWEQTCRLFPQIKDRRVYFEAGSGVTNNYYIAAPHGEIYGADHNMARFTPEMSLKLRPESPVSGLFLTGQDIFSCGFSGGLYSGVLTASKVLNRNLFIDLFRFTKNAKIQAATKTKSE